MSNAAFQFGLWSLFHPIGDFRKLLVVILQEMFVAYKNPHLLDNIYDQN